MSDEVKTAKKWSAAYRIPTDTNYVNRIVGPTFGPSKSSGNPMVTVPCQVVAPENIECGDDLVCINGVETTNYFTTTVFKNKETGELDEEKTANARTRFKEFWTKMGLDIEQINWDNIDVKPLDGLVVLTQMESEEEERRKTPTSAQIAEAKKKNKRPEGDLMKNPITGKTLVNYWPKIREFFGLAPDQSAYGPY